MIETIFQFVKDVGPITALIIITALYVLRFLDRRSKIEARDEHSHLDDTETLRTFAKEDRMQLAELGRRNLILSDSNYKMAQEIAELRAKSELFQEKTRNDLDDCHDEQAHLKEQLDKLRRELEELRQVLAIKDSTIAEKDAIIQQLRAG